MREIKFRAWNTLENKMLQSDDLTAQNWNVLLSITENEGSGWRFMQYTGLKDKNGKEIYEGDIVKTLGYISEVKFKHGAFIIGYHGGSSTATRPQLIQSNAIDRANKVEIIGNIYENQELLGKE